MVCDLFLDLMKAKNDKKCNEPAIMNECHNDFKVKQKRKTTRKTKKSNPLNLSVIFNQTIHKNLPLNRIETSRESTSASLKV